MKKLIFAVVLSATTLAHGADLGLDPQDLKVKVYKFAVSTSEYCTNPITVFSNANPVYEDMLNSPTFGTGSIPHGTYKCVMLEMSDVIKFSPAQNSDSGTCVLGQEETLDVCRANNAETTKTLNGPVVNCIDGEDKVVLYLSVSSTNGGDELSAFQPPRSGELGYGLHLGSALKVTQSTSGTLVINGLGQVSDRDNNGVRECELNAPAFSFR